MKDKIKSLFRPIESVWDLINIWASLANIGLIVALVGVGLSMISVVLFVVLIPIFVFAGYQMAKHDGDSSDTIEKQNHDDEKKENEKRADILGSIVIIAIPIVVSLFFSPIVLIVAPLLGAIVSGIMCGFGYLGYRFYMKRHPKEADGGTNDFPLCTDNDGTLNEDTSVFCTNCGEKISTSDRFCVFCGTPNIRYNTGSEDSKT